MRIDRIVPSWWALALLAVVAPVLSGCGDDPVEPEPEPSLDLGAARVAYVDETAAVPRLMATNMGLAEPVILDLDDVRDRVEGNQASTIGPNSLIYMARPRWSPDGEKVAVIVGTSDGLSRIVVVNVADTTESPHVASINTGLIVAHDWHPDSDRLAWAMEVGLGETDLYMTELEFYTVTRITESGALIQPRVRWDTEGDDILASSIEYTTDDGSMVMPYTRLDRYDTIDATPEEVIADVAGLTHDISRAASYMLMLRPQAWNDVERRYTTRPVSFFVPEASGSFFAGPGHYEFVRYAGDETRVVWGERVGNDEVGGLELTMRDYTSEPPSTWTLQGAERLKGLGDFYVP